MVPQSGIQTCDLLITALPTELPKHLSNYPKKTLRRIAKHWNREYREKTTPSQIFVPCDLSSCRVSVLRLTGGRDQKHFVDIGYLHRWWLLIPIFMLKSYSFVRGFRLPKYLLSWIEGQMFVCGSKKKSLQYFLFKCFLYWFSQFLFVGLAKNSLQFFLLKCIDYFSNLSRISPHFNTGNNFWVFITATPRMCHFFEWVILVSEPVTPPSQWLWAVISTQSKFL